jgi:hypothetical protein
LVPTLWQNGTTLTSATFSGQDGHTYRFTSVGTDNAGSRPPTPAAPQATTRVDATPPGSGVNPLPAVRNTPSFLVSWSGGDNRGGSGLQSFDVFVAADGGAFQPWLTGTAQASATCRGRSAVVCPSEAPGTDRVRVPRLGPRFLLGGEATFTRKQKRGESNTVRRESCWGEGNPTQRA